MTRILGIDPGTNITGLGIIETNGSAINYIYHEILKTGIKNKYSIKLASIHTTVNKIILEYQPNQVAIESVFFSVNAATAIKLGQARGAALTACGINNCDIYEYTPRRVKLVISGSGASDKIQLQKKVKKILNIRRKLEIDASDALAVAICHGMTIKENPESISSI